MEVIWGWGKRIEWLEKSIIASKQRKDAAVGIFFGHWWDATCAGTCPHEH